MNRAEYVDYIEFKLSLLATRIEVRGGLNILDLHLHSENFYAHLFNLLFNWKLENLNVVRQNSQGVDLFDVTNRIVAQVSATATRQKIEAALAKDLSAYSDCVFKFIAISKDAKDLRTKSYANPHGLKFTPADDIYDVPSLLKLISGLDIVHLEAVYEFIRKELKSEPDPERIESNLMTIINVLSKEDWNRIPSGFESIPYDIEAKILYNELGEAKALIEDHKVHYSRIDKIYASFDQEGLNKSLSVLNSIRTEYCRARVGLSSDQCFFATIDRVIRRVKESRNHTQIAEEELELCVQLLVVDAFIRCKIFRNPEGAPDANT